MNTVVLTSRFLTEEVDNFERWLVENRIDAGDWRYQHHFGGPNSFAQHTMWFRDTETMLAFRLRFGL